MAYARRHALWSTRSIRPPGCQSAELVGPAGIYRLDGHKTRVGKRGRQLCLGASARSCSYRQATVVYCISTTLVIIWLCYIIFCNKVFKNKGLVYWYNVRTNFLLLTKVDGEDVKISVFPLHTIGTLTLSSPTTDQPGDRNLLKKQQQCYQKTLLVIVFKRLLEAGDGTQTHIATSNVSVNHSKQQDCSCTLDDGWPPSISLNLISNLL